MSYRRSVAFCLLTPLVFSLAACGGSSGSTSDNAGAQMGDTASAHLKAAVKEGQVTWYTAHYGRETADAVAQLFEDAYPNIKVNLYRDTAQRLNQRFLQEEGAKQHVADVIGVTELGLADNLAKQGLLAKYTPTNEADVKPEFAKYNDPSGFYHIAALGSNIISYNKDQLTEKQAPHSWKELLDPKWKGKIATGNPAASGYVGTWATQMYHQYGPEYLKQLSTQKVLVGQSITDTNPRLASGERSVGVSADQTTAISIQAGDPVGIIYPTDGAVLMPTPNAISAQAPHPNAARLFADFMISTKVQDFLAKKWLMIPIIKGLDSPSRVPKGVVKYDRPDLPYLIDNLPTVIAQFRKYFGV